VDAWAVGILCYELLVGYPPFEQESRAATYEHIMYKEPKFPVGMSEEAKRFVSAALVKVRGVAVLYEGVQDCNSSV
jgi:aurora kinase, other